MQKSKKVIKRFILNFAHPFKTSETNIHCADINYQLPKSVVRIIGDEGSCEGQLSNPGGVAILENGQFAIADQDNNRILITTNDRQQIRTFGIPGPHLENINRPTDVCITSQGQFILTDSKQARVKVFSEEGHFLHLLPSQGPTDHKFASPCGIAVTQNDYTIVTDVGYHTVTVFNPQGRHRLTFGGGPGTEPDKLNQPCYVAVSRERKIIVADCGNKAVKVFSFSGIHERTFASHVFRLKDVSTVINEHVEIRGVCMDKRDNILVVVNTSVCLLTMGKYQLLRVFNQENGLRAPRAIACSAPSGLCVVTDANEESDNSLNASGCSRLLILNYNSDYFLPFCRGNSVESQN